MKAERALAVICVILLAGVTVNFAVAASQEEHSEYRWLNTSVIENVWPSYTPQELEDNYYAYVLNDRCAGLADCGSMYEALDLFNEDSLNGKSDFSLAAMGSILKGTVAVTGNDSALIGMYRGFLQDEDRAADFENVGGYIAEIEAMDTPEELEEFVANGGSGRFVDVYFQPRTGYSAQGGSTIVLEYPRSPWIYLGGLSDYDSEYKLQNYKTVLELWFADDLSKAEVYYEDYRYACGILRGAVATTEDAYTYDGLQELFQHYPISADLHLYREKGCDSFAIYTDYASALDSLIALDNYRYARAIAVYHVLSVSAARLGDGYAQAEGYATSYQAALFNDLFECDYSMFFGKYYTQAYGEDIRGWLAPLAGEIIGNAEEYFSSLEWLSNQTRQKICGKIDGINVFVCGPSGEQWDQYDYSQALQAGSITEMGEYMRGINEKILLEQCQQDFGEYWPSYYNPTSYNSYYSPTDHSIVLCTAFFLPMQLDSTEDYYAKALFTIAHELSHAFDRIGIQYDEHVVKNEGWLFTEDEQAVFDSRLEELKRYVCSFEALPGHPLNGELVLNEYMADMGSLAILMHAASKIDGFDYDRFFRGVVEMFAGMYTEEQYLAYLASDTHPIGAVRFNIDFMQTEEFRECYGLKAGDGMYQDHSLNPWRP